MEVYKFKNLENGDILLEKVLCYYLIKNCPYQHYTNAIENYFSILKSKLRKLEGIKYDELKENIKNVLKIIPKEIYMNIFKGSYEREIEYKKK